MITGKEIVYQLSSFGIGPGCILMFEAPNMRPKDVEGDLAAVTEALQDLLDPEGTLVMPTTTAEEGRPKPIFDPILTPSEAGPLSEFFRKQPGVLRSHSTTHSVAARGPAAEALVAGHRMSRGRFTPWGEMPFGHGSPWDYLYEQDAWWVLWGADLEKSPFLAYLQALYGERSRGITKRTPFPRFSGETLGRELVRQKIAQESQQGSIKIVTFRVKQAVDASLKLLAEDPGRLEPDEEFRRWLAKVEMIRQRGYLRAGVAKAVITPTIPRVRRWDGSIFTGVSRDLYARVVVLDHGGQRIALVLCDLEGIALRYVTEIRQQVQKRIGLSGDYLMVSCTHSHSAPDTIEGGNGDPDYLDRLVESVANAVCQAAAALQPVRLGWGKAKVRGLGRNRRLKMPDGRVFTVRHGVPSTWRVDPGLIAGEGPVDQDLTVVRIERLDGELLAAIANYACHANVALLSTKVSGDFFGEAMALLEGVWEESAVILCTAGTAGNVDPTADMPVWGPRSDEQARHLGHIYAAQVFECLERLEVGDDTALGAAKVDVDLPVRRDWIRMMEEQRERLRWELVSGGDSPTVSQILRERTIHTEVQVLRLNDLLLVGLPGEVFVQTGQRLKREDHGYDICIIELANDSQGYIPTPEAMAEGGYETDVQLFVRLEASAEAALLDAARRGIDLACAKSPSFHTEA